MNDAPASTRSSPRRLRWLVWLALFVAVAAGLLWFAFDRKLPNNRFGLGGGLKLGAPESRLLRRADGTLDLFFFLDGSVETPNDRKQRFLLVIRPRFGERGKSAYVHGGGHGGGSSSGFLGIVPGQMRQFWDFTPGEPPEEFAEEIKQKGLWEPAQ